MGYEIVELTLKINFAHSGKVGMAALIVALHKNINKEKSFSSILSILICNLHIYVRENHERLDIYLKKSFFFRLHALKRRRKKYNRNYYTYIYPSIVELFLRINNAIIISSIDSSENRICAKKKTDRERREKLSRM